MNTLKTPEDLFETLKKLGISVSTEVHEPLFTVDEGESIKLKIKGAHAKNLFLKNKKGMYYLITMLDDKRLDLKIFAQEIGCGSLSFASDPDLIKYLGVEPGHVTPFALINPESKDVKVILDKEMMQYDVLNFHPLKNHMTTSIGCEDFLRFLNYVEHEPLIRLLPKC